MEKERINRRLFLKVASSAALLPHSMRADVHRKISPLVIFFQGGAQSSYEFLSPLVSAPSELRGSVEAIEANNGELIDSRWQKFAAVANQVAVIRDLDSGNVSHDAFPVVGDPSDHAEKLSSGGIPHPFIELPSNFSDLSQLKEERGMHIKWDKDEKRFKPPEIKVEEGTKDRMALLRSLEHPIRGAELMEKNRELAYTLLSGGGKMLHDPFVKAEKERYGNHPIGDACALASQFAQSGAGVTLVYNEFLEGWDLHSKIKEGYDTIIPPTDQALAELIIDSRRHGFVLLTTTEHGRTRNVNSSAGRDHHNVSYAVLSGGGIRAGVHGKLKSNGEFSETPVTGKILMKTVLQACGLEQDRFETINSIL